MRQRFSYRIPRQRMTTTGLVVVLSVIVVAVVHAKFENVEEEYDDNYDEEDDYDEDDNEAEPIVVATEADVWELCRRDATWKLQQDDDDEDYECGEITGWNAFPRDPFWWKDDPLALNWLEGTEENIRDCIDEKLQAANLTCHSEEFWDTEACLVTEPEVTSHYSHVYDGDLVTVNDVLTLHEAVAIESLAQCAKELLPQQLPFYEERPFIPPEEEPETSYGMYAEMGGNYCTFLSGFLQEFLPGVAHSLYQAVVQAYNHAEWQHRKAYNHDIFPMYPFKEGLPHPTSLGIRTAEFLEYRQLGRLGQHADAGSILTISVALSDPDTDYDGGYFQLASNHALFKVPRLSAIVFFSEVSHAITPMIQGNRKVFVVEFWNNADAPLGLPRPKPSEFRAFQESQRQKIAMFYPDEDDDDEDEEEDEEEEDVVMLKEEHDILREHNVQDEIPKLEPLADAKILEEQQQQQSMVLSDQEL